METILVKIFATALRHRGHQPFALRRPRALFHRPADATCQFGGAACASRGVFRARPCRSRRYSTSDSNSAKQSARKFKSGYPTQRLSRNSPRPDGIPDRPPGGRGRPRARFPADGIARIAPAGKARPRASYGLPRALPLVGDIADSQAKSRFRYNRPLRHKREGAPR
jgi:hypothetical protein